jgi:rRNA maturation RNase YbeY
MNGIAGDIFISVDRVKENASDFGVEFDLELKRVMAHGVLHLLGFGDKSEEEASQMRLKEDEKIKLFHVEH